MTDGQRFPRRFRRRLALTFVVVAGVAGGALAIGSFSLARQYRVEGFENRARREAELNLGLSAAATEASLDQLVATYRQQEGFEVVVGGLRRPLTSRNDLTVQDVPTTLLEEVRSSGASETKTASTEIGSVHYLVVGGQVPRSDAELYFFFSLEEVLDSLAEFRTSLVLGWLGMALFAALIGDVVARRTLRPVRQASDAARALAEGLLDTRLSVAAEDEFGAWATYFNEMADALAHKIAALSDATDRERRFTADVAHELRTPLTALANASSVLAADIDRIPTDLRRPADLVVDGIARLRHLVEDLLELSRLDSGQQAVHLEELALDEAVQATIRAGGWEDTVELVTEPTAVIADRHRLDRVVGNLISNALVHGGGEVAVRVKEQDGHATVEVTDNGPGIPVEETARIFERFSKAESGSNRAGSGLGLAIAAENARLLGGHIEVLTTVGAGAAFTLVLPGSKEAARDEAVIMR